MRGLLVLSFLMFVTLPSLAFADAASDAAIVATRIAKALQDEDYTVEKTCTTATQDCVITISRK